MRKYDRFWVDMLTEEEVQDGKLSHSKLEVGDGQIRANAIKMRQHT
jgi:hypothetical protein